MSPIFSGGVDVAPEGEDLSALSSSLSSTVAASAAQAWAESPTSELLHVNEMAAAKGVVPDFGGPIPPDLAKTFTDQPDVPREQAAAQVKAAGLDKEVSLPDTPHVKQAAVDLMIQHAQETNQRAATIADGPKGFMAGALDYGTGFLVGAADPLNVASTFIPVVGEARYAKLMAGAGSSILGRAAVRAGIGAAQGAAFGAGFLPLAWAADTSDGRDFTLTHALTSVLASAGQFGFLHVGGGALTDLLRTLGPSRARKPLYPFAPGEPFERATEPVAAEPAAAAPAAAGAEEANAPGAPQVGVSPAAEPGAVEAGAAGASPAVQKGTAAGAVEAKTQNLDDVLKNPRVGGAFANLKIDSAHDVPFGAGADKDDPSLVHVDRHVPEHDVINGVQYDPRVPVALHEIAEHDGMEHDGLAYPVAHRTLGETAEKAWVDEHLGPGAWPIYTRRWDGWLSHIEPEKVDDVPETLYDKPYPFKQREQIERLQRHEAAGAGERRQIAQEVTSGVYRAGRPKDEAKTAGALFAARYATRASRFEHRAGSALDLFRAEHLGIRRGDPNFISSGRAFDQATRDRNLVAEREAEGQQSLPGTERIGQGELAQRGANAPLKPKVEQRPMDVGLFGDEAAQKMLFQEGTQPSWYYSAVGRAIEGAKQEKATPAQWLATLRNTPGVKPEEIQWLGLEDWLKEHKGPVTRSELADYVRANQIEVREVEKGASSGGLTPHERMELDDLRGFAENDRPLTAGQEARLNELTSRVEHQAGSTKFSQYALPGGENYRELLLTLPARAEDPLITRARHLGDAENGVGSWDRIGGGGREHYLRDARREFGRGERPDTSYKSAHWDEPNVLAHVRFDDRVTDGKKTLHLAEIQSDWHQQGRKRGYQLPSVGAQERATLERERDGLAEEATNVQMKFKGDEQIGRGYQYDPRWIAAMDRITAINERLGEHTGRVPDAPFKTTWPELALKRMIRYAAENGYGRLSWDTGATNAERYDLSKQIGVVRFDKFGSSGFTPADHIDGDTRGQLTAFDHSGREVMRQHVEAGDLPDYIGKDAADKLLAQEGQYSTSAGVAMVRRKIEGLDLKVGGEGMRGFYDKILPAAAAKLTKKFGTTVTDARLSHPDAFPFYVGRERFSDEASAEDYARRMGGNATRADREHGQSIHALDITPQLREAATSQGFPLFQGGEAGPRGRITMAPNRSVIDLFKSADPSTFLHEAGHLWLEELVRDAAHDEVPQQIRDDLATTLKWLGVDKPEDIGTEQHEKWARGFEQYLMEGNAPSKGLAAVFEKFREWLSAIYRSVSQLREPITDDVRGVMDRLLASDPEIAQMQDALRRLPDPAKQDVLRGTIGSMADGKGSPAAAMIKAAAEQNPAVARAVASIPDVAPERNGPEPQTPAQAFQAIAERKAPHEEEAAIEAFKGAEKLPEPPSPDAEVPRTASLAEARRAAAEGADVDLKVNKPTPRGPRARPEATWSLMEHLAARGGLDPADRNIGDVKAILGRGNKFIPGFGHLIRKGGLPLDRARESAVEASYLRDNGQTGASEGQATTTIRDLLDALDDEARGKRRYREGVGAPAAELDPAQLAHYREEAERFGAEIDAGFREGGIDPATVEPDLRARVAEIMTREGETDPLAAWERAVMERQIDDAETGQYERHATAIPGWDEPDDAGTASAGGRSPGASGQPEGQGNGAAPPGAGTGAGEAGSEAGLDRHALTPLAKAAVAADRRSAQNFEFEAAGLAPEERLKVEDAIAAVDREAATTADIVQAAALSLATGGDRDAALAQATATAGDRADRGAIAGEVDALDGAIKVFEQDGMSKAEAAQRATDARLDKVAERAAIARRTEREHSLAIVREWRRVKGLVEDGTRARDALESITGGVSRPFLGSRKSIDAVWHTLHDKYVSDGGIDGALRREGLGKLAYSKVIDADIEREMFELDRGDKGNPGVTKNKQAQRIAQIFHAADKQAMEDHNLAGGWLRSLSGHSTRQQWNPEAIRAAASGGNARRVVDELKPGASGQAADRRAFMKDFLENLDLRRTFGRMPMQAIRDQLYQLWIPLKNGDHFDYTLPSDDPIYPNVGAKAAAHREFFFKNADAARAMRLKYGLYPSFIESKYRGYEGLARQTALIGRLGPKPEEAIRELRTRTLELTKATDQRQAVEKFVNGRGGDYEMSMLDKQMGMLTGKANKPLYALGSRIAAGWMAWERMSMLGRVLLTHIEGLPTKSSELRYWGASALDRYKGFFADMRRAAPESERGKLMQLIWSGHDADNAYRAARYDSADTVPGVLARLSDVYFRLTGITHVLPNQRQGAQHVMARELAMERGKAFGDIDPKVSRILQLYGIGDKEWSLLHGADWTAGRTPDGAGPGGSSANAFLTPEDALKLPDDDVKAYLAGKHPAERPPGAGIGVTAEQIGRARNDLATSIATMYSDRGAYAMFQGASVRTKARLYGNTLPGTLAGTAVRLLWQFKQWPVEMIYRSWGREIRGGDQGMGRVASIVELAVAATVMGTLGEMVRDAIKGEDPLPRFAAHPVDYLIHGMMRSGIGSIAGDYLFGQYDRHFRTVLESAVGPTFGQINDVFDLYYGGGSDERHPWHERAADLMQLLKTNGGPLVNYWATSWAFQYLVLFRLQEWMHPGYVARYQQKMEKEEGVHFLVSPTAAIGR